MWIIQDWTGTRKFPDKTFETFQDGIEFLMEKFPNEDDLGEFYVVKEED